MLHNNKKQKWNWNWRTSNNSWYGSNHSIGEGIADRQVYLDALYDVLATYWSSLTSAVVENAAPTKVVLTFGNADTTFTSSDFKVSNFVVTSLSRSGADKVLTLTLSKAVVHDDTLTVTLKEACSSTVTNNVS
jgi:hypothetical protein